MRQTALDIVYELAVKDPRVVFIGSDLGAGVLKNMKAEFPSRFFMEGISEQHIIGMAAGMAMEGKVPYLNTIATFFSRRAYEQVALDLCLHNLPVRLISSGGGVVYAPLGPTHLAIEDIAILRTLPHMTIIAPADAVEMRRLMEQTLNWPGPIYIRVAKGGDPIVTNEDSHCRIGEAALMRDGADALVVTTGITLKMGLDAASELEKTGVKVAVLHYATVKPFDESALLRHAGPVKKIVVVEEGVRQGGLGSAVAEVLAENGALSNKSFRRIGLPDKFPDKYGSQASLMDYLGVSTQAVIEALTG